MDWLRAFGRFFEKKIGLHRLGIILSIAIITVAAVVLYRKLHNMNVSKVLTAMATVEYRDVAISALFVALGYFTLTFYDLFALRTIGRRDIPYRVAALGSLTSYSIGRNVGAPVLTGGAVPHLFSLGTGCNCGGQGVLHRRTYVLARQRDRARSGHRLCAAGCEHH